MINLKYNDEFEIICDGIVDLGVFGKYPGDRIEIAEYDIDDIEEMSENERSITLVDLNPKYNDFVKRVEDNIKDIENQFIICFFEYLMDVYFDFSDCKNITFIKGDCVDIKNIFSNVRGENFGKIHKMLDNTSHKEINGFELFNKYLPMIDINIILKSIEPHFLSLEKDYIQFEIHSDECDGELITSMIIDINNELKVGISNY